jgi:hypothetical protein
MVEFLEIKDEKILKYLLLIIIGYLIFKVFNTCGNGFNVGGAFGGTRCIGPYDPNDSNTYCENGDIKYECNTIDVCNSYNSDDICTDSSSAYIGLEKNKCPSMNSPPNRETRMRDGVSQNLLEHYCGTDPKYLSNYRDLILRGGETIIGPPNYVNNTWEGNDRCWTSPALTSVSTQLSEWEHYDEDRNKIISLKEYYNALTGLNDKKDEIGILTISLIIIHLLNNITTELKPREFTQYHPAYTSNEGSGRTMSISNTNPFQDSYYGDTAERYINNLLEESGQPELTWLLPGHDRTFVFISPTYVVTIRQDNGLPEHKALYGIINYDEYNLTTRSWSKFIDQIRDGTPENIYESSHIHSNVENIFYDNMTNTFIHPTHESLNNEDLPQIGDLSRHSGELPAGNNITMYLRYDHNNQIADTCKLVVVKGKEVVKSININPEKNYVWAYLEWTE